MKRFPRWETAPLPDDAKETIRNIWLAQTQAIPKDNAFETYLDFQRRRPEAQYRRMYRLIAVRFGIGDIVIKSIGQRMPESMDNTDSRVTIIHVTDKHP